MKAGAEIHLIYCVARCLGRVFSREQFYNAAWGEGYELLFFCENYNEFHWGVDMDSYDGQREQ